ncbi:MAG: hypothetical protein ACI4QR_05870 [Eubacteriales bacterium]
MFYNDFEKKCIYFLFFISVLMMLLPSCGRRVSLHGGAHEVAADIYSLSDAGNIKIYEENISPKESYTLGISEDDFYENIEEAKLFHISEISGGRSLAVVVAKNDVAAGKLFERMYRGYDWVPCDPCDKAAFMIYGRYIVIAKDDSENTSKFCSAFSSLSGGGATVKISENPM